MSMPFDRRLPAAALAVAVLAFLTLNGCGLFGGESAPAPVDVIITAAARLNPDDSGAALPTVVRIYQLKGTSKAEAAQFEDLYRRDKELLGEDLLQLDEVVVAPGATVRKTVAGIPEARAVMVVGVFRRPAGLGWRIIAERKGKGPLNVRAEDYRIERQ
jgi:type VI secretion system protein VasD